jgi:hypothetical protein
VAKCSLAVPQVWVNALACLFASWVFYGSHVEK